MPHKLILDFPAEYIGHHFKVSYETVKGISESGRFVLFKNKMSDKTKTITKKQ